MTSPVPAAIPAAHAVDAAVLLALGLFLVWGSMHGLARQALGLVVVALGFVAASALSSSLEASVAKVADLEPDARGAVAWLAVWVLVLVLGGVLLHGARGSFGRDLPARPASRAAGALVGLAKGVLVLGVVLYAVLGTFLEDPPAPPVAALRASRSAAALASLERLARPALRLPPAVGARVALANATVRRGGAVP